ncbi:MAG: CBS domain-containing protein [Fimbriiglobus sp.]|jgi:CBS domain-containing protein|nr:CBS domain-containing protein [Fimbriiglobus sp.]
MELTRNLMVESVGRLNPPRPLCVDACESVAAAVATLRRERVGCVLVVEGGELAGIFTERDLLKKVLARGEPLSTPVTAAMTARPVSVNVLDSVRTAVERMQVGGYRHVPVVDEGNRPVGVLSAKRIVRYLAEHYPTTVYNQPPDPLLVPETTDGA